MCVSSRRGEGERGSAWAPLGGMMPLTAAERGQRKGRPTVACVPLRGVHSLHLSPHDSFSSLFALASSCSVHAQHFSRLVSLRASCPQPRPPLRASQVCASLKWLAATGPDADAHAQEQRKAFFNAAQARLRGATQPIFAHMQCSFTPNCV
eukprot:6172615-Pleurochrysis_carterae.AAC.2